VNKKYIHQKLAKFAARLLFSHWFNWEIS